MLPGELLPALFITTDDGCLALTITLSSAQSDQSPVIRRRFQRSWVLPGAVPTVHATQYHGPAANPRPWTV